MSGWRVYTLCVNVCALTGLCVYVYVRVRVHVRACVRALDR